MKMDGSEPIQLPSLFNGYPNVEGCWSSDGKKIALVCSDGGRGSVITVMNSDGSDPISLFTYQAITFDIMEIIGKFDWYN
jgi:Tol biopolymer transport system component